MKVCNCVFLRNFLQFLLLHPFYTTMFVILTILGNSLWILYFCNKDYSFFCCSCIYRYLINCKRNRLLFISTLV